MLGSLGAALGRWACQRDAGNLLAEDWQETAAFRREISDYLREFLELGAGEDLGWYSQWYETSEGTAIATDWDRTVTATAPAEETPLPAVSWDDPDVEYRDDSNVLYRITGNGYSYTFSNSGSQLIRSTLPEGYNFLLVFQDSKVSIWKDGEELDVYGDGVYDGDSDWFVPGYDNFPAGDNVSSVKVYIAVLDIFHNAVFQVVKHYKLCINCFQLFFIIFLFAIFTAYDKLFLGRVFEFASVYCLVYERCFTAVHKSCYKKYQYF